MDSGGVLSSATAAGAVIHSVPISSNVANAGETFDKDLGEVGVGLDDAAC